MKNILIIISFFLIVSCSKPKTVFICGDHICVNKSEAQQYFEENLSKEVKIINKKNEKKTDLVELNLETDTTNRQVRIKEKKATGKRIKSLSNQEIRKIKVKINKKNNEKKLAKKTKNLNSKKSAESINKDNKILNNNVDKKGNEIVDICTNLKKCSIDEISKLLLKQGKTKKFPDITVRE